MNTEKKIYSVYPEWHIVQIIHHIKQNLQGDFKCYIEVNFLLKLLLGDTISGIPPGFFIIYFRVHSAYLVSTRGCCSSRTMDKFYFFSSCVHL